MDRALEILQKREQTDVLKRGGGLLREAFVEVIDEPGGQIESVLRISHEIIPPETKPNKKKEIILVRAE